MADPRNTTRPGLPRAVLDALARELTDRGMLIEAGFASLRAAALPTDTSESELHERRMMFFAGAQHLFGSIMSILDPEEEVTDADMQRMSKIAGELQAFIADYELRFLPAEGRA